MSMRERDRKHERETADDLECETPRERWRHTMSATIEYIMRV